MQRQERERRASALTVGNNGGKSGRDKAGRDKAGRDKSSRRKSRAAQAEDTTVLLDTTSTVPTGAAAFKERTVLPTLPSKQAQFHEVSSLLPV